MSKPTPSNDLSLPHHREMTEAESRAERRFVRTIPGWVQSVELDDEEAEPTSRLLSAPTVAQVAQHNYAPAPKYKAEPGRLYDLHRTRDPVILAAPGNDWASRWRSFALATAEPIPPSQHGRRVSEEWWRENMTDYSKPWNSGGEHGDAVGDGGGMMNKTKRKAWYHRAHRALLRNPLVPLYLRLTVLVFSLVGLVLGTNIWHRELDDESLGASTIMAIAVDAVALVYLLYIMYDEYTGKPLGLRSAKAKLRLILLDLFFIIFESANLSLAFDSLIHFFDDDYSDLRGRKDFDKQKGLCAVLLIALIAWLLTFGVSIFRLIERVAQ
ncbi:MAG: hypothetical protein M1812_007090 [Candelaria pacifica]|nr:MAG: hypothetical protein M1812_007090 [Candelaria pacifica]